MPYLKESSNSYWVYLSEHYLKEIKTISYFFQREIYRNRYIRKNKTE